MHQNLNTGELKIQRFGLQELGEKFDLNQLIKALKTVDELTLIQNAQTIAKFQYKKKQQLQNKIIMFAQLAIKTNQIEIKCSYYASKDELKCLQKNLAEVMQKLSEQSTLKKLAFKIYFDIHKKLITIQSHYFKQLFFCLENKDLVTQFTYIFEQSYRCLKEVSNWLNQKKNQLQARINYDLAKIKELFETSRIRREKSTKICLLSKNKSTILNKVVMNYRQDIQRNTLLARQLYISYKQTKQKLSKQPNKSNKKMQQVKFKNRFIIDDLNASQKSQKGKTLNEKIQKKFIVKPILIHEEQLIQNLQEGGFGQVQKHKIKYEELLTFSNASQKYIQQYYAANKINLERKLADEIVVIKQPLKTSYGQSSFSTELTCLSFLRNQNCQQIAQYYNSIQPTDREQDCIKRFIRSKKLYSKFYECQLADFQNFSPQTRLKIAADIMQGIKFISQFKILHRDLKPKNMRLNQKGRIKIIDFGSACLSYGSEIQNPHLNYDGRFCFSPMYTLEYHKANPTNMSYGQYTKHILYDLYAYGKIIQNYFGTNRGDSKFLQQNIQYLSKKCMEFNPDDRLNPAQVLTFLKILLKFHK